MISYRNLYLKWKLRTYRIQIQSAKSTFSSIHWKKDFFFQFFTTCSGPSKFFGAKFFKYFWKNVKNGFTGTWQTSKETKSWILVSKVQNLWKWWTDLTCMGHNGPYSCEIGLRNFQELWVLPWNWLLFIWFQNKGSFQLIYKWDLATKVTFLEKGLKDHLHLLLVFFKKDLLNFKFLKRCKFLGNLRSQHAVELNN